MKAPTERFSTRVNNYTRYRPSYPLSVLDLLREECGLTSSSEIADIGSGTGILSKLFLGNGNLVYAVEPNKEMREEAEHLLEHYPNFRSIAATAEETALPSDSVDFVTAGQAFHWFDAPRAMKEFQRITRPGGYPRPGGWIVLVWNTRRDSSPFLRAYEDMLRTYSGEYLKVRHQRPTMERTVSSFLLEGFRQAKFDNRQLFGFEGLKGRLLSSSYAPEQGHPQYQAMMDRLREMFDQFQTNDQVTFEYDTQVYYGHAT